MDGASEILTLVRELGIPGAFVAGLLLILWKGGRQISAWAKPLIEQIVDHHIQVIDSIRKTQQQLVQTQATIAETQTTMEGDVVLLTGSAQDNHNRTHRILQINANIARRMSVGQPYYEEVCKHCDDIQRLVTEAQQTAERRSIRRNRPTLE